MLGCMRVLSPDFVNGEVRTHRVPKVDKVFAVTGDLGLDRGDEGSILILLGDS